MTVYTVRWLYGKYCLFCHDSQHRLVISGDRDGELVNAFRVAFPEAVGLNPDDYERTIKQRSQRRYRQALQFVADCQRTVEEHQKVTQALG